MTSSSSRCVTATRRLTRWSARAWRARTWSRAALAALRSQGWEVRRVRVEMRKRIPVAAGMGGGSADAAAALRLAAALRPVPAGAVERSPPRSAPTCPASSCRGCRSEPAPARWCRRCPRSQPHAYVIVPLPFGLSTADVYREADRLGLPRADAELAGALQALIEQLGASGGRASSRAGRQRPRAERRSRCGRRSPARSLPCATPARSGHSCAGRARRSRGPSPVPTRGPARRPRLTRSCPATLGPAPPSRSRRISVSRSLRRGGPRSPSKIRVGRRILGHNS